MQIRLTSLRPALGWFAKNFNFGFRIQKPIWEGEVSFKLHFATFTTTSFEQISHL